MKTVYVKGYVGNLGTKVLIEQKIDELVKYFNNEFIYEQLKRLKKEVSEEDGMDPSLFIEGKILDTEEISRGGVLTALWKICDRNKWGLKYNLKEIPIMQGTIEISNYFDLNPYRLLTSNAYIYIVEEDEGMVKAVVANNTVGAKFTSPLVKIGEITNEKKRVRIDGEAEAFLTKDFKDELDRIISRYTQSMND